MSSEKIETDKLFQIDENEKELEQNKFKLNEDKSTKTYEQLYIKRQLIILLIVSLSVFLFGLIVYLNITNK